jgi:hypothetical protein
MCEVACSLQARCIAAWETRVPRPHLCLHLLGLPFTCRIVALYWSDKIHCEVCWRTVCGVRCCLMLDWPDPEVDMCAIGWCPAASHTCAPPVRHAGCCPRLH